MARWMHAARWAFLWTKAQEVAGPVDTDEERACVTCSALAQQDRGHMCPHPHKVAFQLTPRELGVLRLLAQGLTAVAIAHRLTISPHTVAKHQENAYRKLGTTDRLTTILLAQALGLLEGISPPTCGQAPNRRRSNSRSKSRAQRLVDAEAIQAPEREACGGQPHVETLGYARAAWSERDVNPGLS